MGAKNEKRPGRRPGADVASMSESNDTSLSASRSEVKRFSARFECLPPRGTRQAGTRLCVVGGKPRSFKTARAKREEANMLALLLSAKPDGFEPFDVPVAVSIRMVWPYRKTERRRIVRSGVEIPLASRAYGDLDNQSLKAPLDACVAAQILRDDSLVAECHVARFWGPGGYWELEVKALDEEAPRPEGRGAGGPDHLEGRNRPCGQVLPGLEGGAE